MRRLAVKLSVAGAAAAAALALAAPAAMAAAPPVPDGCTFDHTNGTTTCTTTSVGTSTTQTVGYYVSSDSDGSVAASACQAFLPNLPNRMTYAYAGDTYAVVTAQTYQVTTTTYQGVAAGQGNKPTTTVTSTSTTYSVTSGTLVCFYHVPTSANYSAEFGTGQSVTVST